ncbi:oxysterol-binding protein-related protein 3c [Phtheirospermum japonicum]|uniref:Oxysterol-binding protein-related protein 3c n=1 Tax=Phtheirospermum japonicum TaxID=374723 RepID=A0A830B3R6_9LAMI|nr:oxysterol-binding protein-related protein 3c [Phtheirospermum japonicum]
MEARGLALATVQWNIRNERMLGYEGVEVINPEGGKEDAEEEAQRGRWKDEVEKQKTTCHKALDPPDTTAMLTRDVVEGHENEVVIAVGKVLGGLYVFEASECGFNAHA